MLQDSHLNKSALIFIHPRTGAGMKTNLSENEWKLMNCLWDKTPMTITELTAALKEETGWSKNIVITMLSRLEAKGAVAYRQGEKAKQYFPLISRDETARAETKSFLGRVYGGSLGLMMNAMVESHSLTEEDIAELSAILDRAGGGRQ